MSVEGIIEKILSDAREEAARIIGAGKEEARSIRAAHEREAQEYYEKRAASLEEFYRREKERAVLTKKLEMRKSMLQARQAWMAKAFSQAYEKLTGQPFPEYRNLLISLIQKVSASGDEEIIFGTIGDEKFLEDLVKELNSKTKSKLTLSGERKDFPWGFVLKKGNVEINMSIDSLFRYKRADLEQKAWELFNADL